MRYVELAASGVGELRAASKEDTHLPGLPDRFDRESNRCHKEVGLAAYCTEGGFEVVDLSGSKRQVKSSPVSNRKVSHSEHGSGASVFTKKPS
jgi:hypothetical protein